MPTPPTRRPAVSRAALAAAALAAALLIPASGAAAAKKRPAAKAGPLVVGIAEQHPELFTDPLFTGASLKHARLLVGWNGIWDEKQRAEMDAYLNVAHAQGVDVLVTFGNSRTNGRDRPTPARFLQAFRAVRQRYPWVTEFSTWNEPNLQGSKPEMTARYWRTLSRDCRSCTILAADLVDTKNMVAWVKRFRKAAKREPGVWGLHNYVDANQFKTRSTRALIKATRGKIWLTETGGVVERNNGSPIVFATGTAHAAQAVRFIFDRLVPMNRRIRRVYLYNWRANPYPSTWDSALTNADGTTRPAYDELLVQQRRLGVTVASTPPAS